MPEKLTEVINTRECVHCKLLLVVCCFELEHNNRAYIILSHQILYFFSHNSRNFVVTDWSD